MNELLKAYLESKTDNVEIIRYETFIEDEEQQYEVWVRDYWAEVGKSVYYVSVSDLLVFMFETKA
jgi:hypothetical protein